MEFAIVKLRTDWMPPPKPGQLLILVCATALLWGSAGMAQEGLGFRPRETASGLPLPQRRSGSESDSLPRGKTISSSSGVWSAAVSLGLIVGVLLLVGRGLKRYGFKGTSTLPIEAFEVLGRRMIEPKVAVHLVRCGNRVLVLGIGNEGVRTLSEIDDPAEVERLTDACRSPSREGVRAVQNGQPAASNQGQHSSGAAQRAFLALIALGISLAIASPVDAQSPRTGSNSTRSRELNEARPQVPAIRANGLSQVAIAQANSQLGDPQRLVSPQQLGLSLKMLAMMTVFSLAPSILMMTTCFVRFTVVLGLLRQALGSQQAPPNQVLTAICLFLTFLVMSPIWQRCYHEGIHPYTTQAAGEQSVDEATALVNTISPVRQFMSQQIDKAGNADAIWMLLEFQRPLADSAAAQTWHEPASYEEVPLTVLAPAYLLSELKVGFLIGFQLFLPFVVIDLVVAMILASLGLTMLPPSMVSLPFKLLLFVLIDGWFLTVGMLLESVRVV
jgi:flagellar biosynthetic protein FliP